MLTVILAIGREILRGRVQDTNSWTLARRRQLSEVIRTACDDLAYRAEIGARRHGGGPHRHRHLATATDRLCGMAEAIGSALVLHPGPALVAAQYAALARRSVTDDDIPW
jgi:hypothetical protein